jgi:hypothetical protein
MPFRGRIRGVVVSLPDAVYVFAREGEREVSSLLKRAAPRLDAEGIVLMDHEEIRFPLDEAVPAV